MYVFSYYFSFFLSSFLFPFFSSFLSFILPCFLFPCSSSLVLPSRRYDVDEEDTVGELGLHTGAREPHHMSSADFSPPSSRPPSFDTPSVSRSISVLDNLDGSTTDHPHLTINPLAEPLTGEAESDPSDTPHNSNSNGGTPSRGGSTRPTARGKPCLLS